jgi:hypothetical protein
MRASLSLSLGSFRLLAPSPFFSLSLPPRLLGLLECLGMPGGLSGRRATTVTRAVLVALEQLLAPAWVPIFIAARPCVTPLRLARQLTQRENVYTQGVVQIWLDQSGRAEQASCYLTWRQTVIKGRRPSAQSASPVPNAATEACDAG